MPSIALGPSSRAVFSRHCVVTMASSTYRNAGDYAKIDRQPLSRTFTRLFRNKLALKVGQDSALPEGYDAVIDLTRKLHAKYKNPRDTQIATREVLRRVPTASRSFGIRGQRPLLSPPLFYRSLFPSWLLPLFRVFLARPFPDFSNKMNAVVTAITCKWLMGPNVVRSIRTGPPRGRGQLCPTRPLSPYRGDPNR